MDLHNLHHQPLLLLSHIYPSLSLLPPAAMDPYAHITPSVRRRNGLVGVGLVAFVGGVYAYTYAKMKKASPFRVRDNVMMKNQSARVTSFRCHSSFRAHLRVERNAMTFVLPLTQPSPLLPLPSSPCPPRPAERACCDRERG
jgi:hypothetical protein